MEPPLKRHGTSTARFSFSALNRRFGELEWVGTAMALSGSVRRGVGRGNGRLMRGTAAFSAMMLLSVSVAYAQSVGGQIPAVRVWKPDVAVQVTPSVPGHPGANPSLTASQQAAMQRAAQPYKVESASWPSGSATVPLSLGEAKQSSMTAVGAAGPASMAANLPLALASADATSSRAGSA